MHRFVPLALCLAGFLWTTLPVAAAQDAQTATPSKAVNINAANAEQLTELPGVGPKLAARIIEYRTKNGPFKKVEDLMNVRGIGEKNFLRLKPLLSVGGAAAKPERSMPGTGR